MCVFCLLNLGEIGQKKKGAKHATNQDDTTQSEGEQQCLFDAKTADFHSEKRKL